MRVEVSWPWLSIVMGLASAGGAVAPVWPEEKPAGTKQATEVVSAAGVAAESVEGGGYSPARRRDPFTPPRGTGSDLRRTCPGKGLAAEVVDAVALRGIVRGPGGPRVLLSGPGGVGHFGRIGDRLCDARLVAVAGETVRFERDPDPLASQAEAARVVVKTLGQ